MKREKYMFKIFSIVGAVFFAGLLFHGQSMAQECPGNCGNYTEPGGGGGAEAIPRHFIGIVDPMDDRDLDGVEDIYDNCVNAWNPGQENADCGIYLGMFVTIA